MKITISLPVSSLGEAVAREVNLPRLFPPRELIAKWAGDRLAVKETRDSQRKPRYPQAEAVVGIRKAGSS